VTSPCPCTCSFSFPFFCFSHCRSFSIRAELAGFLCNTYLRRCDVVGSGNPECFGINTNTSEVHRCCSNSDQGQPEDGCFAEWPQGATAPATYDVCCTPGIRYECCSMMHARCSRCVSCSRDVFSSTLSCVFFTYYPFALAPSYHSSFTNDKRCCQAAVPQCMFAVQRGVLRLYFQRSCSRTTARIFHRLWDHHSLGFKHPGGRCGRSRMGVRWLFDLENRIGRSVHERIRLPGRVSLQRHGCSAGWQPFLSRIRGRLLLGWTSVSSRMLRPCRERWLRRKSNPRVSRSVPCKRS
jgi:hypothetical protein